MAGLLRAWACLGTSVILFNVVTAIATIDNYTEWVFSTANNGPSTLDRLGGPVLVYNGLGVPAENITSSYPHLSPYPDDDLANQTFAQVAATYHDPNYASGSTCTKCQTALLMGKTIAMARPSAFPAYLQQLCNLFTSNGEDYCQNEYSANPGRGLENANVVQRLMYETGDMDYFCASRLGVSDCTYPAPIQIDPSDWFSTRKPANATAPKPSGQTIKVLHFSDWHLDPRYSVGSEANCTSGDPCCRTTNWNSESPITPLEPASRFGAYSCDTPGDLGLSAFQNMRQVLNFSEVEMAIFTGDLISHDAHWELSDSYTMYTEVMSYLTFKAQLGNIPLYVALGNHDTNPTDMASPNSWYPASGLVNDFNWNYALVSSLWAAESWIGGEVPEVARTHYGGYSVLAQNGKLKIITYNTDFWFWTNIYNYANITNPDVSGTFSFMIQELEAAEAAGQRVWLVGHVESGYSGGDSMPNPTSLFYTIVQRFSPHVIAGIFYGHTHLDYHMIYYDSPVRGDLPLSNQSSISFNPINSAWIAPSITSVSSGNPAWRYYEVDSETFEVIDAFTYYSNITDTSTWTEPVWQFEYSARDAYDGNGTWPKDAPLNATWWQSVTERMARNESGLLQKYNDYTQRFAPSLEECTSETCIDQTVCMIRSGSAAQGLACNGQYLGV
ncbi:hypothetical protein MMC14_009361 [Varicellaria rhodocarpa]|nr:hypothetical protein [Varicellaria rhodocarpa]